MAEEGGGSLSNLPGGSSGGSGGALGGGGGALPGGALDAGQVVVTLMGKFDSKEFDKFDQRIKDDSDKKAVAQLEGHVDDTGFREFEELLKQASDRVARATLAFNVDRAEYDVATGLMDKFAELRARAELGFNVDRTGYEEAAGLGKEFSDRRDREQLGFDVDRSGLERAERDATDFGHRHDYAQLAFDEDTRGYDDATRKADEFGHKREEATLGFNVDDRGYRDATQLGDRFGRRRDMASLGFNVDRRGYNEASALADELGRKVVDIKVKFDVAGLDRVKAEIRELDLMIDRVREVKIKADVDEASFLRGRELIKTVEGSQRDFTKATDEASSATQRQGNTMSGMQSTMGGMIARFGLMTGAVLALAPAVNGLAGGFVALGSTVATAAGGAIAAVPAFLGVMDAQKLLSDATKGVASALEGNAAAYKKLDPVQKQFVDNLRASGVATQLHNARLQEHAAVLGGVSQAFQALQPHLQMFIDIQQHMAQAVGDVIASFGKMLAAADSLQAISALGREMETTFRALGTAGTSVAHAFLLLLQAAEPLVNFLSEGVVKLGQWIDGTIKAQAETGKLADFFRRAQESLHLFGEIAKSTGSLLFSVLKASNDAGLNLLQTFANLIARWAEWAKSISGQNELRRYFAEAAEMTKVVLHDLSELVGWIFKATEPTKQWADTWRELGRIIDQLGPVLRQLIQQMAPQLVALVGQVAELILSFRGIIPTLEPLIAGLTAVVRAVKAIVDFVPGLKELLTVVASAAIAWKLLGAAISPIVGVISTVRDMWYAARAASEFARLSAEAYGKGGAIGAITSVGTSVKGAKNEFNDLKKSSDAANTSVGNMGSTSKTAEKDVENLGGAAAGTGGKAKGMGSEAEQAASKTKGLGGEAAGAGKNLGEGGLGAAIAGLVGRLTGGAGLSGALSTVGGGLARIAGPVGLAVTAATGIYELGKGVGSLNDIANKTGNGGLKVLSDVEGFIAHNVIPQVIPGLDNQSRSLEHAGEAAQKAGETITFMGRKFQDVTPEVKASGQGFDSFTLQVGQAMQKAHALTDEGVQNIINKVNALPPQLQHAGASAMIEMSAGLESTGQIPVGSTQKLVQQIQAQTNTLPPDALQKGAELTGDLATGIAQGAGVAADSAKRMGDGVRTQIDQMRHDGVQINGQMLDQIITDWGNKEHVPPEIQAKIKDGVHNEALSMSNVTQEQYRGMVDNSIDYMIQHQGQPPKTANEIREQVNEHAKNMKTGTYQEYVDMVNSTIDYMEKNQGTPPDVAEFIRTQLIGKSQDMAINTIGATKDMVDKASENFRVYGENVKQGVGNVGMNVNEAMKVFGLQPLNFGFVPMPSPFGTGPASLSTIITGSLGSPAEGGPHGNAMGGPIGRMGAKGKDEILSWLGEGEYVLTSHMQPAVQTALKSTFGFGLENLQDAFPQEHWKARGGPVQIPKFDAGGFPDQFMHPFTAPRATGTIMGGGLVPSSQGGFDKATDAANKFWEAQMQKMMDAGGGGGGNMGPILSMALAAKGALNPGNMAALTSRMMQESGGRNIMQEVQDVNSGPNAARGILQMTPTTFAANAVPGHGNIWNPLDNALSAVDYMLHTYGHIVGGGGDGYARGGRVGAGGLPAFSGGGSPFLPGMTYEGWDVAQLQKHLGVKESGKYDAPTINAIRDIQNRAGMPPTGIAPQTLREAIIDKKPLTDALTFMKDIFPSGLGSQVRNLGKLGVPMASGGFVASPGFYGLTPDFPGIEEHGDYSAGYTSWWEQQLAGQFPVLTPQTWSVTPNVAAPTHVPGAAAGTLAILDPTQIYKMLFPVPPGSMGGAFPTGGPLPSFADWQSLGPAASDISWLQGEIGRWNTVLQQSENEYGIMGSAIQAQGITRPQDIMNQLNYRKRIGSIDQAQVQRLQALVANLQDRVPQWAGNPNAFQYYQPLLDQSRVQLFEATQKLQQELLAQRALETQKRTMVMGDISNFNNARQALYQQAGSNFASPFSGGGQNLNVAQQIAAQTTPSFSSTVPAQGMGASMPLGSMSGGGNYISINNYYSGSPTDAMTWAQQQAWELRVAM